MSRKELARRLRDIATRIHCSKDLDVRREAADIAEIATCLEADEPAPPAEKPLPPGDPVFFSPGDVLVNLSKILDQGCRIVIEPADTKG